MASAVPADGAAPDGVTAEPAGDDVGVPAAAPHAATRTVARSRTATAGAARSDPDGLRLAGHSPSTAAGTTAGASAAAWATVAWLMSSA